MYPQARKIHAVLSLHPERAMTAAEIAPMAEVPVASCRILLWMLMDKLGVVEQCEPVVVNGVRAKTWRIAQERVKEPERLPIDDLLAMFRRKQCAS